MYNLKLYDSIDYVYIETGDRGVGQATQSSEACLGYVYYLYL